jgi:hypothetical protein
MGEHWFEQKRYGYGAGPPKTWQGWVLILLYLGIIAAGVWVSVSVPRTAHWMMLGIFIVTVPFLLICRAKTRGGWRWRWGSDAVP